MITDSFDNRSEAIINPVRNEDAPKVDACIITFSWKIEEFVLENYAHEKLGDLWSATGPTPVYQIAHKGKRFAFYKTCVGAPISVGLIEDTFAVIRTDKYIVFGGVGCLNKEIAHGKVMVPTAAYRDEGDFLPLCARFGLYHGKKCGYRSRVHGGKRDSLCVGKNVDDGFFLSGNGT